MTDRVARIQEQWRIERPDLDVSPLGLIGRLHRLAAALTRELEVVYEAYGLSEGDFDVLATLRRTATELTAGDLATATMVTTGGTTKRLDRLERAGLVVRRVSETDGRSRVVALTGAGRRLIDEAFTTHVANEHRLVGQLDDDDAAALERILRTWLAHHEQPADAPSDVARPR
ncbi:DNA-binding transcriptional regulator, MarR family [Quadrisphaera granulorum]|uniref:DNA-binding MarR family transcriptional regulator n=1 Tax=Quadrisphaera granulorum TaxID=317664 RepID=A0A315ZX16_9ACTN|nr:MarR family transcriptional regulator [Quadrisphaera granulorum]PWJ49839.1 DNA-binding MarR family transcriptional regulator [Quadrisphaera granulorum]SZE98047.1 DNA-binding transcriptional regulator, MarR family [Quadrisphaera granulorum]